MAKNPEEGDPEKRNGEEAEQVEEQGKQQNSK